MATTMVHCRGMRDDVLSSSELEALLQAHPAWAVADGKLHRELEFDGFPDAFGFMTRVALAAEKLDHHPDWSNSWNKVVIDITNHAAGGISDRCFELAAAVERRRPSRSRRWLPRSPGGGCSTTGWRT